MPRPRLSLSSLPDGDVLLRPVRRGGDDDDLLLRIYASTRADELDLVAWPPGERDAFERMQFRAQCLDFDRRYPRADHSVIEVGGEAVGRLVVDTDHERVLIVDVALLPGARGHGLGTDVLGDVLAEADGLGLPVQLHVEATNRARRLYRRLGFEAVGDRSLHQSTEWMERPCPSSPS